MKVRPENEFDRIDELGIPLEIFAKVLLEELSEIAPKIILAVGAKSLEVLCLSVAKDAEFPSRKC